MAISTSPDMRNQTIIESHSALAKLTLDEENSRVLKLVEAHKELSPMKEKVAVESGQFVYHAMLDFGGLLYAVTEVTFFDWNNKSKRVGHFFGQSGGPVVRGGVTWGTAWLNYPIESIQSWEARFLTVFVFPAMTNINWWGMSGETIGSFVGGGLVLGGGEAGGQGKFGD